jgi:hypothetical protein
MPRAPFSLPPAQDADVAAALSAGLLPRVERMLRQGARSGPPAPARDAAAAELMFGLPPLAVLTHGSPREVAALVVTLRKVLQQSDWAQVAAPQTVSSSSKSLRRRAFVLAGQLLSRARQASPAVAAGAAADSRAQQTPLPAYATAGTGAGMEQGPPDPPSQGPHMPAGTAEAGAVGQGAAGQGVAAEGAAPGAVASETAVMEGSVAERAMLGAAPAEAAVPDGAPSEAHDTAAAAGAEAAGGRAEHARAVPPTPGRQAAPSAASHPDDAARLQTLLVMELLPALTALLLRDPTGLPRLVAAASGGCSPSAQLLNALRGSVLAVLQWALVLARRCPVLPPSGAAGGGAAGAAGGGGGDGRGDSCAASAERAGAGGNGAEGAGGGRVDDGGGGGGRWDDPSSFLLQRVRVVELVGALLHLHLQVRARTRSTCAA